MNTKMHDNPVDMDDEFDYEEIEGEPQESGGAGDPAQRNDQTSLDSSPGTVNVHSRRRILVSGLLIVVVVLLTGATIWLLSGRTLNSADALKAYPVFGTRASGPSGPGGEPKVGGLAPDFELTDVSTGKPVRLSSLRGRPVWLNYFATWCPPCKDELPIMKQEYARHKDTGLTIVGIDMREDPGQVKAFTESNGYDWTFVVDTDGKVTDRYFVYGIPTHLFIDKEGIIKAVSVGGLTLDAMKQNIATIVGH